MLTVYVPPLLAPVPVPSAVMYVPATTPVPLRRVPTVKRPVPWVVSVKVVVEILPLLAAVVAVSVAVSVIPLCVRFVPPPMIELGMGLPAPRLRSYHVPAV